MALVAKKQEKATFKGPNGRKYSLFPKGKKKWRLNGRNWKGERKRPLIHAETLAEARTKAEEILFGLTPETSGHPGLEIFESFARAVKSKICKDTTKKHYVQFAGYFCDWVEKQGLSFWHQLRFFHLQDYLSFLVKKNLKRKTISHYLEPLRFTSKWMAVNWPDYYQDIAQSLRIPNEVGEDSEYHESSGNPVLLISEVVEFLDWLNNYPKASILRPGVALQGLCGLQLQEALRLTWKKVDLRENTITIDGQVKNRWRKRKIPVASLVSEILFEAVEKNNPTLDDRIIPATGESFNAYSKLMKRALMKWRPSLEIAPKDLRNTIQTEGIEKGWNDYLLRRYVGHAARSVSERHYFGDKGKRLVHLFREQIVSRINDAISESKKGTKGHKPEIIEIA